MSILRFMAGILLLPLCISATRTLVSLIDAGQDVVVAAVPPSALALGGGFVLWTAVYFLTPQTVRTYVLAHELTHALWGSLMGAQVLDMRISRDSGSVTLSKSNFLVTLAPYFFPLYTVLVILAYYVLSVFVDVDAWEIYWLVLVGFTWGFHVTFTARTLLQHQTDIREYGRVFSFAVIYLMNVLGICFWVVIVSSATLEQMVCLLKNYTSTALIGLWELLSRTVERGLSQ